MRYRGSPLPYRDRNKSLQRMHVTDPRRATSPGRRGLTLVEVLVSMVLVGVLLVASLRTVGGVFETWSGSQGLVARNALAQQLMAEIVQQSYRDPDGLLSWGIDLLESGTDRSAWDDVDDYDGWSSAPRHKDGSYIAGYSGWNRQVTVAYVRLEDPTQVSLTDQGLKRITVTVTDPQGGQTILVAYRSRWGIGEQAPETDSTDVTYISSELAVGSTAELQAGASLLNSASDPGN